MRREGTASEFIPRSCHPELAQRSEGPVAHLRCFSNGSFAVYAAQDDSQRARLLRRPKT